MAVPTTVTRYALNNPDTRDSTVEHYGQGTYALKIERITTIRRFESKIWMGKQSRPEWISFRTEAAREEHIANRKTSADYATQAKVERAAARKAFDATQAFTVGDILVSSWGWEQTNVDFYEVIAVTRGQVTIEKIGQRTDKTLTDMAENVVANPAYRTGEVTRHRVTSDGVKIASYAHAYKWDGKPKYQSHYG